MDRQLLLAKTEDTYGTDAEAAAANTVWAENIRFEPTGQRVTSAPAKPGVGAVADQTYGEYAVVGFEIPLVGSGEAGVAPKWGFIHLACGYGETIVAETSVTYGLLADPLTDSESLTLVWRDGNRRVHLVTGWKGTVNYRLSAGGRPMAIYTGKGIHHDVTTAGAPLAHADAVFTGWLDAKPVSNGTTTFSFAGVSNLGVREFTLDQNDTVNFIDVPGQELTRHLGERIFTGSMKITCPLPSTLNLETKWRTGAVETFSLVHDTVAGRIVTVNGRTQLIDPRYSRENAGQGGGQGGDDVASASLKLVPSSLVTDNELAIVCT
ncbi:MAG: hypothetical protein U1C74_25580 [Phenylobacterium sp.]|nr:hypothetical protein [Phenylobacterium sp.]